MRSHHYSHQCATTAMTAGQKLIIKQATYEMTAAINGKDHITVDGESWGTIVKSTDGLTPTWNVFNISGITGMRICNLQIDCNKANTTDPADHTKACGVHGSTVYDCQVDHIYSHDSYYRGISIYGAHRLRDSEQHSQVLRRRTYQCGLWSMGH